MRIEELFLAIHQPRLDSDLLTSAAEEAVRPAPGSGDLAISGPQIAAEAGMT